MLVARKRGTPHPDSPLTPGTAVPANPAATLSPCPEAVGRRGWGDWGAAPSQLHPPLTQKPARECRGIHHLLFPPTIHGPAHPPVQHHPLADSTYTKVFRDAIISVFELKLMNWDREIPQTSTTAVLRSH